MKLTDEKIQQVIDGAPEGWTHYCTRNRHYFKRDGNTDRIFVWLGGTKVWSVPLMDAVRWLERRERLEEILTLRQKLHHAIETDRAVYTRAAQLSKRVEDQKEIIFALRQEVERMKERHDDVIIAFNCGNDDDLQQAVGRMIDQLREQSK